MNGDWPQAGYDSANTSYNPNATGVPNGVNLYADPHIGYGEIHDVLVSSEEYIVVRDSDIIGIDRTTEEQTWRKFVGTGVQPVLSEEIIYYMDGFHGLESAADRAEWHRSSTIDFSGMPAGGVVVHGDIAYVGLYAGSEHDLGHLYALDISRRTVTLDFGVSWGVSARPLISDSAIVISTRTGMIGGFESLLEVYSPNGDHLWTRSQPGEGGLSKGLEPLTIGNGRVYAHQWDKDTDRLVAYAKETGEVDWRRKLPFKWDSAETVLIRDILYLADNDRVLAFNSHTGDGVWRYERAAQNTTAVSTPQMAASLESLCVSGAPAVGLNPDTGDVLWQHDDPLRVHAVVDDELVASRDGDLLVFRDTGSSSGSDPTQVFLRCQNCNASLEPYHDPQHCPECGAALDTK